LSSDTATLVCPGCRADRAAAARHPGFGDARIWRCDACGTEFASPQPSDDRLREIYSEDYYEPWHLESVDALRAMKAMSFRPIVAVLGDGGAGRVLDVGCATGEFLRAVDGRRFERFGIDLNSAAIETAAAELPDVRFHAGTLDDEPFDGIGFDAITMIDFIEHVRDPERELRMAGERLAPSGRLVISTPRADSLVSKATGRHWPQYREEHLTYFTLAGLSACMQRAGLVITKSFATRKAVTPRYLHGQAMAYPVPVVTPVLEKVWRLVPADRIGPRRLWFGEVTVVAERQAAPSPR
jgi:2-polyprenyl-3-methyl-5-hydroxy-6-metoxy-1,4-benzoquinol methylase